MAPIAASSTLIARQYDSYYDPGPNYNTVIIIICVIAGLKLIFWMIIFSKLKRKRLERARRGCHCFDDIAWCTPWWYTLNDRNCHCGQLQQQSLGPDGVVTVQPQREKEPATTTIMMEPVSTSTDGTHSAEPPAYK